MYNYFDHGNFKKENCSQFREEKVFINFQSILVNLKKKLYLLHPKEICEGLKFIFIRSKILIFIKFLKCV